MKMNLKSRVGKLEFITHKERRVCSTHFQLKPIKNHNNLILPTLALKSRGKASMLTTA